MSSCTDKINIKLKYDVINLFGIIYIIARGYLILLGLGLIYLYTSPTSNLSESVYTIDLDYSGVGI